MEHPNPKQKWHNMRRMAYLALFHALSAPLWLSDLNYLAAVLFFDAAVVGAYMGFSTARDGWGKQ